MSNSAIRHTLESLAWRILNRLSAGEPAADICRDALAALRFVAEEVGAGEAQAQQSCQESP